MLIMIHNLFLYLILINILVMDSLVVKEFLQQICYWTYLLHYSYVNISSVGQIRHQSKSISTGIGGCVGEGDIIQKWSKKEVLNLFLILL